MHILDIQAVTKNYRDVTAVNNVTLQIPKASIFGLLGPNGAGKTSLIRMITQITGIDSGKIYFDGEALKPPHTSRMGYMPEERGLYKKMKVGDHLVYLAELKDMKSKQAKAKIKEWMERFEMDGWWNKKIQDLSKGMQQKVQFIATVMHQPALLILDEPFSGLDPINARLIRTEIDRMVREKGTSVIFSTHRMEQVEEICEYIALINNGRCILNGPMLELKQNFKKNRFAVQYRGDLPAGLSDEFQVLSTNGSEVVFQLNSEEESNKLLRRLLDKGIHVTGYNEVLPTMNEIFIEQVENNVE